MDYLTRQWQAMMLELLWYITLSKMPNWKIEDKKENLITDLNNDAKKQQRNKTKN